MNNRNDSQPQHWERLNYNEKVVEVWQEHQKYAKKLCKTVEDGEDIVQDVAEIFLNVARINDIFVHKETQTTLRDTILALQNNAPLTNDYNRFTKTFSQCLRSLAKKKIREDKNLKINIYEFTKICRDAGVQTESPIVLKEIDNFFESLRNKNVHLQEPILYFIDKKNGFPITKIAQIHNKSVRKIKECIAIVSKLLEKMKT